MGEVAKYRNGKAHENDIDEEGEYIVVNSKFVSTDGKVRKYSHSQNEPLYKNEIAFVLSDVPNGRAIARTFLVDKSNKYTLNQRIAGITPFDEMDAYFLHIKMNRNAYFLRFDDGNKQTNLSINDVMKYEDMYPIFEEQKKIGAYFRSLDHLITLHQRKPHLEIDTTVFVWEQRKFGEVFEEYSVKNHEELLPLTIIQGGGTILREESDRALQYDKSSLSGYKMVKKNDFIVHLRSFEGGLEKANTDGIISPAYHTFHGENTDSRFYYPFFRSKRFIDTLLKPHVYGIRDGKSIDIEGMKSIMIPVPSYKEQQAIGGYIETLDHLITLHQRKPHLEIDTTVFVWEQRKVADVFNVTRGYVLAATETSPDISNDNIYPVYSSQTKNEGLMGYYSDYLYEDAITWTTDGANAGTVKFRKGKFYCTNVCGVLLSNEGIANKAVAEALNAVAWKYVSHVGNPKLMNNVMSEIEIIIPKSVEEQLKISEYFDTFDTLLTLHQHKCEELQKIKKFMLQNMFV